MFYKNKVKGFTLIELLVVISIVSLLSSIVFTSLNSARAKARDAQRTASIRSLQTALELYYDDNGSYPVANDLSFPNSLTSLVPTYINVLPVDPDPNGLYKYHNPWNPPTSYAIFIGYEIKTPCYVCTGSQCVPGFWGKNICQ